jgi:hypothetical protein
MKKKYFPTKCAKDGFKVYENGKIELVMILIPFVVDVSSVEEPLW